MSETCIGTFRHNMNEMTKEKMVSKQIQCAFSSKQHKARLKISIKYNYYN